MRIIKIVLTFILIGSILSNCARRGSPSGGPKDIDVPINIKTVPAFKSVNFKNNKIEIYFDEYIKLEDIRKNLIISPPLKYPADILPLGLPSKKITIKLKDTLIENTTYTFNFGESLVDNNEGNILQNFKYIFSTGPTIDSLYIKGTISDAFNKESEKYVSILLYKANKSFNDSTIFKEKPLYMASTLDSLSWEITNLKKGKYYLIALKTEQTDFKFRPKSDKIAFLKTSIEIPNEEEYNLNLFKEILDFNTSKPVEVSKGHLIFGYVGDAKNFKVKLDVNKTGLKNIKSKVFFDKEKDTLHYYYKTAKKVDSLFFDLLNGNYKESNKIVLRSSDIDSLKVSSSPRGILSFRDTLTIFTNNPLEKFKKKLFSLVDKDTVAVAFKFAKNGQKDLQILFDKKEDQNYKMQILPNAITDFFNQSNKDTLNYFLRTKKKENYGSISLDIKQTNNKAVIVQLLDKKEEIIEQKFLNKDAKISFELLKPATYLVRIILDTNNNHVWDTGNYLKKLQPEKVYYFNKEIELKENWDVNEIIDLKEI